LEVGATKRLQTLKIIIIINSTDKDCPSGLLLIEKLKLLWLRNPHEPRHHLIGPCRYLGWTLLTVLEPKPAHGLGT
jgi:hypothetical protein